MSDLGLIVVSIISVLGGVIITQLLSFNYFKRENFRYNLAKKKKADNLQFSKIRKDLGLGKKANPPEPPQERTISELLQNLDIGKIKGITNALQRTDDDDEEGEPSIMDTIGQIAQDNPELVQRFLGGMNKEGSDEVIR